MVRHVNLPPEVIECKSQSHQQSDTCQPCDDDNNVTSTTSTNYNKDNYVPGIRRRSLAMPKDNIGIACLPTSESMRLRGIPEVPERGIFEENGVNAKFISQCTLPKTKITGRARGNAPRDNIGLYCRRINNDLNATCAVRLCGGEDHPSSSVTSSTTDSFSIEGPSQVERVTPYKPKDNIGLFGRHVYEEPEVKTIESKNTEKKSILDTTPNRYHPMEMGISNIRRPKYEPTKPRKPIVPKDNLGLPCRYIRWPVNRSNAPKVSTALNVKKKTSNVPKKKELPVKPITTLEDRQTVMRQTKTLQTSQPKSK